jgi:hypothetical protein
MSVNLTIVVADITATLAAGYTHIKVYRSSQEETGFVEITIPGNLVELQAGISTYSYIDKNGNPEHWYRVTYYDINTPAESVFGSSFKGVFEDTNFNPLTYAEEAIYTNNDHLVIDKVRTLIGDRKELIRDYVSALAGYSTISEDGYTHSFTNPRGWPVSITLDDVVYTELGQPQVNDYQFITFSGITINTTSGTLDVWYYNFRFSDSEILKVYNALTPPSPLTEDQVTFELKILCCAIELISSELRLSGVVSGTEVAIFEEIKINPKGGLDSRLKDLLAMMEQKQEMIDSIFKEVMQDDLFGVLID